MSNDVVLSAALRNNLASLQKTQSRIDRAQNVLATGLRVSSALDDPQNFFASQSLKSRSSDLSRMLDGIAQSIQTIKTADAAVTSITKLVEQAQSIVDSARDAITNGSKEAAVTGRIDLSKITSSGTSTGGLTSLTGIANGAELKFTVKDADGNAVVLKNGSAGAAGTVQINTGDSIDELITEINDLVASATGEAVFKADLTAAGNLRIKALDGASFNVTFDSDGDGSAETASDSAADLALASALGFGSIALQTAADGAASQLYEVGVTSVATTKLVSGKFFASGSGAGYASASDLLTTVENAEVGTSTSVDNRFVVSAGNSTDLKFTINGTKQSAAINIDGTSIQGLVDSINNDSVIGSLVEASYDSGTGEFSIEALSATVETIKIDMIGVAETTDESVDFDFGTKSSLTKASSAALSVGETYVFASAASALSTLETDYNTVRGQISELVEDSAYRGVNLVRGDTLDTYFNEDRTNKLSLIGQNLDADGLDIAAADFSRLETIETAAVETRAALTTLRSFGSTLATSLSVIQTRETFTKSLVETLNEGSDKLTVADQNEEGAKLLALQTRQQLGITALSLASQSQQAVLRLF
jgi:flagellin